MRVLAPFCPGGVGAARKSATPVLSCALQSRLWWDAPLARGLGHPLGHPLLLRSAAAPGLGRGAQWRASATEALVRCSDCWRVALAIPGPSPAAALR